MIRFTVITVTYNARQLIERTADSVMRQTWHQVEHLIIDGQSADGTAEAAEDYRERSSRLGNGHKVTVVSEPDRGIYDAMNKGLQRADGDYVLFLNAGDILPSDRTLQTVADSVAEGEPLPGVLYGDTDIIDGNCRVVGRRPLAPPTTLTWQSFRQGMLVCHQAFYARTDIARDIAYDLRFRHSADVDWCIRIMKECAARGLTLRNVHATVAGFLDGGDTTRHHRASLLERFQVMRRHYGLFTTLAMHGWFIFRKKRKHTDD